MHGQSGNPGGVHPVALASAAAFAAALAVMALPPPAAAETRPESQLAAMIRDALREGGPFFTPDERAVVERKCGYEAGSWDGFEINVMDGALHCTNGRRVDDPEVRAIMARAEPRIEARVEAVMERAEISAMIAAIANEAAAKAVRAIEERWER